MIERLPLPYLAALSDDVLQRMVTHRELLRAQRIFRSFPEPMCGEVDAHVAIYIVSLMDNGVDDTVIGEYSDDEVTVVASYMNHEMLVTSDNEWWAPVGLYVTVKLAVTRAGETNATDYATALRWDEAETRWRLLWETSENEDAQVRDSITALVLPPGASTPSLMSILTYTRRSHSVLPPSPGGEVPAVWRA